ncbi:MAG: FAD:protein FMN transferase [Sedimentisphaerales bacterium]|nr:FAD:protein FMN transferase [Sedimentisphaerales bacterium]
MKTSSTGKKVSSVIAVVFVACLIVVAIYFSSGPGKQIELDSGHRMVMGTFARAVVIAKDADAAGKCIESAFTQINKVDSLMSDYKSDSEISSVNRDGFKKAVQLSLSTYEVLQRSIEFSELTDGAFDITIGPMVELFRKAKRKQVLPDQDEIKAAKSKVGFEKLKLDDQNRTVQFTVEGMKLDMGGIAKGYAVDKAVETMQAHGAIGGMVDLGGDIRCFGAPFKGRDHWVIGLQNPNMVQGSAESEVLLKLKIANGAIATSGDYQQFIMIEGKRRSHIIDRKTGTSTEGLSSVTIIADNATNADALATAVSVMGYEKGLELIEKIPGTEAILITSEPEFKLIKTSGAERYIKKD